MKYLSVLLFSITFIACNNDNKTKVTDLNPINKNLPKKILDIEFIKTNSLGSKGVYDLNKIDLNNLISVDSTTLSKLPEMYQGVYGDDYLYFYDFNELEKFDLLTLINGNQFGDFLQIFVISKESKVIISDTNIVLDGSEDAWEGQSKGFLDNDNFQFEMINQIDSVGYSETEFTRKIDTVIYNLIPSLDNFQVKIQYTNSNVNKITVDN